VLLRASYDIYNNYTSYQRPFTVAPDIRPDGYARDYHTLQWRDQRFEVVPLPGHTFGSTGYLFELDGRTVLAVSDLLYGPGSLW